MSKVTKPAEAKNQPVVNNAAPADTTAPATETAAAPVDEKKADEPAKVIKPEPTSAKLTELRAVYATRRTELAAIMNDEKATEEDQSKAAMAFSNAKKDIANEILAIEKAEKDAELQAKRSAKMAVVGQYKDAVLAEAAYQAGEYAAAAEVEDAEGILRKPEDVMAKMNELTNVRKTLEEQIQTELVKGLPTVARVGTSTSTTGTSEGSGGGKIGEKIKERLLFHLENGKTVTEAVKEVVGEGYTIGTTGTVRTQMKKAGELVKYGENPA